MAIQMTTSVLVLIVMLFIVVAIGILIYISSTGPTGIGLDRIIGFLNIFGSG